MLSFNFVCKLTLINRIKTLIILKIIFTSRFLICNQTINFIIFILSSRF